MRQPGTPNPLQQQQQHMREQWQRHQMMGAWQQQRDRQVVPPPTDQDFARRAWRPSNGMEARANAFYQQPEPHTPLEFDDHDAPGRLSCVGWVMLIVLVAAVVLLV